MQIPKEYQKLISFDLDKTLVKAHYHNLCAEQEEIYYKKRQKLKAEAKKLRLEGKEHEAKDKEREAQSMVFGPEEIKKFVGSLLDNEPTGPKNPENIKSLISSFLARGDHVAITTFNEYPEVIEPILKKIGLTEEEIAKIHVVAFLPEDQGQGKGAHLQIAMEKSGIENKHQVYLVDDDENNCKLAKREGYNPILVDDSNMYLTQLNETIYIQSEREIRVRRALREGTTQEETTKSKWSTKISQQTETSSPSKGRR